MPTEGLSEGTLAFDLPKYGADLKLALDAAGLSYREAERVIGVDHNTLQRVASGTRPPNVEHYLRIERWLAARAEGPAPPGGAETALRKLLAPADLHHVADHERLRLSSRRFDLGLTIGELRAALTKGVDHG